MNEQTITRLKASDAALIAASRAAWAAYRAGQYAEVVRVVREWRQG